MAAPEDLERARQSMVQATRGTVDEGDEEADALAASPMEEDEYGQFVYRGLVGIYQFYVGRAGRWVCEYSDWGGNVALVETSHGKWDEDCEGEAVGDDQEE